jgi:putative copper resistance protein D
VDWPLVFARFLHFAATMTLFGAAFFAAALAPASLGAELAPLMRRLAPRLAVVALASAAAWLLLVAREMAGGDLDFDTLSAVVTDTAFGPVWTARLVILALLVATTLRPDRRWRLPALIAGLAVASLGLVGHAAMQDGALGVAHRLNHAVHLLATSGWLGGLPLFLVCLGLSVKSRARADALRAMMRYSRAGHVAVAAVFVSGALDVAMTTHALPWPPDSPYRVGLDSKISVFAAMTALALFNRYVLAPRISRSAAAARALAAGAVAEIVLAMIAISLVSAFATLDPHAP